VLAYTGLGFPNSGCKITLDDPAYDGRAGKQMVSVLAGTKTYLDANKRPQRIRYVAQESKGDPRVGMIGGSYGGQIQYAVAMQDKRVDALIPIITWNDLSYSLAPNNTSLTRGVTYATPGVGKREWVDLFFSVGITDGVQGGSVDPSRNFPPCPNFADEACTAAAQLNTAGYPDDATLALARHASVSTYAGQVKAPTLLVQGFVEGPMLSQTMVAWDGVPLAGFARRREVAFTPGLGASAVVRVQKIPAIREFTERLCRAFGMSGFFSVQFIEPSTGAPPVLLEINRRIVTFMHTDEYGGVDLCGALFQRLAGLPQTLPFDMEDDANQVIVSFPREWLRDPDSAWLRNHPSDVPWDDPGVFAAMIVLRNE